jgi:AraC-like DNA-binding protein
MDYRVTAVLMLVDKQPQVELRELAAFVNLSPSRLRHLWKGDLPISLCRFVKQRRLLRAEHLLRDTFLSVKEVCAVAGFSDTSHFVRDFRKKFGLTPSHYRLAADSAKRQP